MKLFDKDFFSLQLDFADIISKKHHLSFEVALFNYTSLYVRLIGFSDETPPLITNPLWQKIINNLQRGKEDRLEYIYREYQKYESNKSKTSNGTVYGCFSYNFHKTTNDYELHFHNADPLGNLGKDRIESRISDLKHMFSTIKSEEKKDTTFFVRTWLLNIEAFRRLFPQQFILSAKPWGINLAQDNSHWGQFLDRNNKIKQSLADELINKAKDEFHEEINLYFPLQALIARSSLHPLYSFYGI